MPTEHHETWLKGTIKFPGGTELDLRGAYALLSDGGQVDTAVVFVHGFLGDVQGTWLNFQEFICAPALPGKPWTNCDVFFFAYPSFRQDITESATQLLGLINYIFPTPPAEMFDISKQVPGLPEIAVDLRSRRPTYTKLVLVGHSEGGVVIRRAVDLAYSWKYDPALNSRLALFAPAHRGVKLSGWIGACLAVGRIEAIAIPILRSSPAFSEMKDKGLLQEIEKHTHDYLQFAAAKNQTLNALKAHVVFGESESAHYTVDVGAHNVALTDAGIREVERAFGCGNLFEEKNLRLHTAVQDALEAHALLRRDVDYLVKGGRSRSWMSSRDVSLSTAVGPLDCKPLWKPRKVSSQKPKVWCWDPRRCKTSSRCIRWFAG